MNKRDFYEKYDECYGMLAALAYPEGNEKEVLESLNAAINCKTGAKLHLIALAVSLHCGLVSLSSCPACIRGQERLKAELSLDRVGEWPEYIHDAYPKVKPDIS
jgi:hypothetical protein